MTRKTEAGLIAIGIVLALNAVGFALGFIYRWLGLKPGIDYRPSRSGPETVYVRQLVFLILAFIYYRHHVNRD